MYLLAVAASTTKPTIKSFFDSNDPDHDPNKEIKNWASIIGITTAIIGNVLIALALNVQRYAHIRLHRQRRYNRARAKQALKNASNGGGTYGTITDTNGFDGISARGQGQDGDEGTRENDPLAQSFESGESQEDKDSEQEVSSTYLRDPYWWLGQVLITVGECGNFLAYGFAPASIVSPLGVVALISNCVIAPLLFKEVFRKRDFWGVIIAVAGAVTVVLSANTQETKLEPHDVWNAITTMEFEIYVAVTCSLIAVLMWASPRYGNRTILIDLGLVGLFGTLHSYVQHVFIVSGKPLTRAFCRRLHRPLDERRLIYALFNLSRSFHHPCHICPGPGAPRHGHNAGPLREPSPATVRLDASHPDPVRDVHLVCYYWKRCSIPRLRTHNFSAGGQVCRWLSSHLLRGLSHHYRQAAT